MEPDEIIADALIGRTVDMFRFTAHERAAVLVMLKRLEEDLLELLVFSGRKLSDATRADKAALLKQAQTLINDYYGEASDMIGRNLAGLGELEGAATAASLGAAFAGAIKPALPPQGFFKSLLSNTLIDGAPSADWWKRQAGDVAFRFGNEVRQGVAAAETNAQIIRRIRGTAAAPGVMQIARSNAAALVQTSVQTVANAARFETFNANEDVIKGWRQLSTLDGHTTLVCVAYSGKEWNKKLEPIGGHDLPFVSPKGAVTGTPRHWNCRSLMSVITKTFAEMGIDLPEFKPTTRSATGGPVAANTTFEQFIDRKGAKFADELLGPGRAELYRDKKITLSQLLDQSGRPLSLDELRKRYL
jgi:hypothetical protein